MTDDGGLTRECRHLCRYLVGVEPSTYVLEKYRLAHEAQPALTPGDRFDRFLVGLGSSRVLRRPAASFARIFAPDGALQCKLVLLLAILESTAPTYRTIDRVPHASRPILVARLAAGGAVAMGALLVGVAICAPARWFLRERASEA